MLAPGSDRIPVELFQILKDDAVESAALNMQYASSRQDLGLIPAFGRSPGGGHGNPLLLGAGVLHIECILHIAY